MVGALALMVWLFLLRVLAASMLYLMKDMLTTRRLTPTTKGKQVSRA